MRKFILSGISIVGIIFTLIEMASYVILFKHIADHNNNVAAAILQGPIL